MSEDRPDKGWWRDQGRHLLSRELDQSGFSQQAFADVMREQAPSSLRGTSLRSLVNYLQGETRPTLEWLEIAAGVLRVNPEWLTSGKEPREPGYYQRGGMGFQLVAAASRRLIDGEWVERSHPCVEVVMEAPERYHDLPMTVRNIMRLFLWDYCLNLGEISEEEADRVLRRHFNTLLTGNGSRSYSELVAMAMALAAAAYLVAGLTKQD